MSPHVLARLSAFMDEELPAEERTSIQEHLGICRDCARHVEEMVAVDAAARELPNEAPAGYFEAFPARVRTRLGAQPAPARQRLPAWTWAVAAALLLAVLTPLSLRKRPLPPAPTTFEAPRSAPAPARIPPASAPPPMAPDRALEPAAGGALDQLAAARKEAKPQQEHTFAAAPREAKMAAADQAATHAEPLPQRQATAGKSAPAAAPPATVAPAGVATPQAALDEDAAGARGRMSAAKGEETQVQASNVVPFKPAVGREEETRAKGFAAAAVKDAAAPEQRQFQDLVARPARTTAEARALREAWREFSRIYSSGRFADEARVRIVEAAATAYRLGKDPVDLAAIRDDAAAYLKRADAAQADRVRTILAGLDP